MVEGKSVSDILLDTGCSRTMIRKDLVPASRYLEGDAVTIRCAHGDITLYHMVIAQCTYCRIGPKSMIYRISTSNEV